MLFVVYFNASYYEWASPFIKSVEKFEPNSQVYIHGYNLRPKHIKNLVKNKNVLEVFEDRIKQSIKKAEPYIKREDIVHHPIRFQITCNKGYAFLNAMKRHPNYKTYILMDIDMVLLKSIRDILQEEMKGKDVGVVVVNEHKKIKGGFISVRNNKRGKRYIERFNQIVSEGKHYFQKDQSCLYKAYEEGVAKFAELDSKYLSPRPNEDALIWSAHKSRLGLKDDKIKLFKAYSRSPEKAIKGARKLEKKTEDARVAEKERIKREQLKKRRERMLQRQYEQTVLRRKRNAAIRAKNAAKKKEKLIKEYETKSKESFD